MHICKTLLIAALCLVAATSASNFDCLVFAGGRLFDLCAFKKPITVPFDMIPYLNVTEITFSLAGKNVPNCKDGTANAWVKVFHPDILDCTDFTPQGLTYSLSKQEIDLHILKITYQLSENDKLEVNLYCNPKGKHTTKIDFFVNSLEPNTLTFSGYSIYGCPVPA